MSARRHWIHGLIFVSGIALPLAQGCGGDDASIGANPTGDGGGDESTTTLNDGSSPTDGSAAQDAPSADAFCAAVAAYASRCTLTDACDVAKVAACSADEAIASAGAIAAYTACAAQEPCPSASAVGDGGIKAYDDCLATHFGTPTTIEKSAVTDYCTHCGAGPDCATGAVAQRLLTFDDAILTEIETTCLDSDGGLDDGGLGTGTKCGNFDKCSRDIIAAHHPQPAACNDH